MNNHTIALISHASKILPRIIKKLLESYIEREMPMEQAGFRIGCRTSNQTTNVRWIMEGAREHQKKCSSVS